MSALIEALGLHIAESTAPVSFERAEPVTDPDFDRYLLLHGRRAYHLGNRCDTCEFLFRRLEGATDKISPAGVGERLRRGLDTLEDDLPRLLGQALPVGDYEAMLLDLTPVLVRPGETTDYFFSDQVELWGFDRFWSLPHDPRTEYYRADSLPMGAGRELFEFVVPMMPGSWLDPGTVAQYADRLTDGDRPTALAVSLLDVKGPADWDGSPTVTEHWCLAHYLLDGHHKMLAASRARQPARLLSLLATAEGVSSAEDVARLRQVLRGA